MSSDDQVILSVQQEYALVLPQFDHDFILILKKWKQDFLPPLKGKLHFYAGM